MRFINLTPHTINLCNAAGEIVQSFQSEGNARVSSSSGSDQEVEGLLVPLRAPTVYGDIVGLPDPVEGVMYVVSMLVAQRAMRPDVVSPDSGPTAVRQNGQVVGVRALVQWV